MSTRHKRPGPLDPQNIAYALASWFLLALFAAWVIYGV